MVPAIGPGLFSSIHAETGLIFDFLHASKMDLSVLSIRPLLPFWFDVEDNFYFQLIYGPAPNHESNQALICIPTNHKRSSPISPCALRKRQRSILYSFKKTEIENTTNSMRPTTMILPKMKGIWSYPSSLNNNPSVTKPNHCLLFFLALVNVRESK